MVLNFQRGAKSSLIKQSTGRQKIRELEGSQIFRFTNAQILTANQELFVFEDRDSTTEKYLPFDQVIVQNLSNSDIQIYVNQSTTDVVNLPAGDIATMSRFMWSLVIRNDSGSTIAASEISILASRARADADKLAYQTLSNEFNRNPFVDIAKKALPFLFFR